MKVLALTFLMTLSFTASAGVLCHTPRMNKVFEINHDKVTFFNEFDSEAKRELASVQSFSKDIQQGYTKTLDFENQKHVIHISNLNDFSDTNDYIIIKSNKGHEVTYPLTCKNK